MSITQSSAKSESFQEYKGKLESLKTSLSDLIETYNGDVDNNTKSHFQTLTNSCESFEFKLINGFEAMSMQELMKHQGPGKLSNLHDPDMLQLLQDCIRTCNRKLRTFQVEKKCANFSITTGLERLKEIKEMAQERIDSVFDATDQTIVDIDQNGLDSPNVDFHKLFEEQCLKTNFKNALMAEVNVIGHIYSFFKNSFSKSNNEISAKMEELASCEEIMNKEEQYGDFNKYLNNSMNDLVKKSKVLEFADNLKHELIDNVAGTVQNLYDHGMNQIKGKFKNFSEDVLKRANGITKGIFKVGAGTQSKLMDSLAASFKDESWKIRERTILNFYLILSHKDSVDPKIISHIERTLLQRKAEETHEKVRFMLDNESYAQEITSILKNNWETQENKVKMNLEKDFQSTRTLQEQILNETDPQLKEALSLQCAEIQDQMKLRLGNIDGIGNQMGVVLEFLSEMRDSLMRIERKLQAIHETLLDVQKDVKYLIGRPISELLTNRCQKVLENPALKQGFYIH